MADDEQPPASVSSLRSRFEQLATTQSPITPTVTEHPLPLRPTVTSPGGSDPFTEQNDGFGARATTSEAPLSQDHGSASLRLDAQYRSSTLPRGYHSTRPRPVSVYSTFAPPRSPPSFRVESPRSPPKPLNLDIPGGSSSGALGLASPASNGRPIQPPSRPTSPIPKFRTGRTPPPPPVSPRSMRPKSTSFVVDEVTGVIRTTGIEPARRQLSPAPQFHDHAGLAAAATDHERREPPPVPTRTTKPKIPSRPQRTENTTGGALAPAATGGDRVSPFSTPPSSANNSPNRSDNESPYRPQKPPRKLAIQAHTFAPPPAPAPVPGAGPSKGWSVNIVAPPPPPRMSIDQVRPRMKLEDSVKGQRMSLDDAGSRPQLPPRPMGLIGGVKARVSRGRSHSPPRPPAATDPASVSNFLPPPRRGLGFIKAKSPIRDAGGTSVPTLQADEVYTASGYGPDDSDEGGSDDQSGLSDYPDSSQANRRRPIFKDGPSEIPCKSKSDVKMFAVCGKYVCTISHSTRVWDVGTGRCIMLLQHQEGLRISALAFKPSPDVENEGTVLWLGTSHGELMEVDIATQRIVETRTSAHVKKEIVKIHRYGFELWTLDDGGKLQVWGPDIHGAPNLRNSPTTFRINPRHSCSIVVDGYLWVGSGKNVDVYQPSTDSTKIFNVSSRQLTASKPAGDITCTAIVNSQPDRVYFGHSDGKVSIYSLSPLACVDVVSVSLYKINSMTGVGDFLWAGFKTGMVYVYDVRPRPWRALKDWQCSDGPILQVVADRTSIWKNGRLQVVTLGADNIIRVWDGMLEDDHLEAEMQRKDVEFCSFREIKALVCTWNAGASKPQDLLHREEDRTFLEKVLSSADSPDIIVFGFQELVDLEDKKITAKTFLKKSKKKKQADQLEHMSHQYRLWQQQLTKSIETHMPRDPYILVHVANMVGLFTCIFIKKQEKSRIRNVCAATVKRGLGGLHGNKGAIFVRFFLDDSSLCFINCHLAAGQSHTSSRNNDVAAILESTSLSPESSATTRTDMFVGGGDGTMILDHEICILNGDLNYRIDYGRDSIINRIKQNDLGPLRERDQLLMERKRNPGFRLRVFHEGELTFAPTYKYDVGTDVYDTSEKKRSPAWCDRLLYRGLGKIKQVDYKRWEVKASDHRPVSGVFLIRVKTINHVKRKAVWKQCVREYEEEVRARHVLDAKMDYLVRVCGYGADEARRTLRKKEEVVDAVRSLERNHHNHQQ